MKHPELFRTRLVERMKAVGTNPSRLSIAIGARDTVRMILSGRSKNPRSDTLEGLARELQCDVRYLLGEIDEPGDSPVAAPQEGCCSPPRPSGSGGMGRPIHAVVAKAIHEARRDVVGGMVPWERSEPAQREVAMYLAGAAIEALRRVGALKERGE